MSQARVRFYINSRNSFINLLVIVLLLLLNYHIIILNDYYFVLSFLATICKTVRPMLSDRCPVCPVCLSVMLCTVAKRWMDQDETWHGGPGRLAPGHIVLDGNPAPPKGEQPPIFGPCMLRPNGWMDQNETWHGRIRLGPGDIVLHGDPAPHGMGHVSPLLFGPLRSGTVAHLSNC